MTVVLFLIFSLCLLGIVIGVLTPRARPLAVASGCILLYVVGCVAWWMALWVGFVSLDRLLAPVRWTEYERAVSAGLYFGAPVLLPLLFLWLFTGRRPCRRRRGRVAP